MRRLDDAAFLKLLDQVYEAALEPGHWSNVLKAFGDIYDAKIVLFSQDVRQGSSLISEHHGFEESWLRSYRDHYGARSPWLEAFSRLPVGVTTTQEALCTRETYETSEFYNEWFKPQGMYATLGVILDRSDRVVTNFGINRYAHRGPITEDELHFFARLAPHVRRALQTHRALAGARFQRDSAMDALGRLSLGVIVVDETSRLIFANMAAEQMLRTTDGLSVRSGKLVALTPAATGDVQASVRRAAALSGASSTNLQLPHLDGSRFSVLVSPLRNLSGVGVRGLGEPAAMLFVHAQAADSMIFDAKTLSALYGLTPAESRLLAALLSGAELQSYAAMAGLSVNTVKTYLKQIFSKTGKTRQTDLLRYVLSDPLVQLMATKTDHSGA